MLSPRPVLVVAALALTLVAGSRPTAAELIGTEVLFERVVFDGPAPAMITSTDVPHSASATVGDGVEFVWDLLGDGQIDLDSDTIVFGPHPGLPVVLDLIIPQGTALRFNLPADFPMLIADIQVDPAASTVLVNPLIFRLTRVARGNALRTVALDIGGTLLRRTDVIAFNVTLAPDGDLDGIADAQDNCVDVFNPDQLDFDAGEDDDSSAEGTQSYGDACDVDFDDDGVVGASDFFGILRPCLGADLEDSPECVEADLDGDGVVGASDFLDHFRPGFGQPPGPGRSDPGGPA